MPSDSNSSYGRAVLELGLVPQPALVTLGRRCQQDGRDLRQTLLAHALITPEQDARVLAQLRGRTAAQSTSPGSSGSGDGDTRPSLLPGGTRLPQPGEQVGGCAIVRELARGGMGAVFEATDPQGTRVAVKVMFGSPDQGVRRGRFLREAEIGENLRHPAICRVLGHGEGGGMAYLVMEFLDQALELDAFVAERQLDLSARLRLMVEVCSAVAVAHGAGIVHRDLKPDNVLVLPDGQPKVVDFGLAKQAETERLTQSGAVMGTLHYMAPEQVMGQTAHADARADVFALGVMLYQLATDELPFDGATAVEIMRKISQEEPSPPSQRVEQAPPGLDDVVATALAKAPEDRYEDAGAMARDLVNLASGADLSAVGTRLRVRARRRQRSVGAGALALLVALALGAWTLTRGPPVPTTAALKERARALGGAAREQLAAARLLGADRAAIDELARARAALEADSARATEAGVALPSSELARASARIRALEGLLLLSRGELDSARALAEGSRGDELPASAALRGAVAAVDTAADPAEAGRSLSRAIARGLARPELLGWRVQARVRAGLRTSTDAEEALADLDALARARGAPTNAERALRVVPLLALERIDDATAAVAQVESPTTALRWSVALARASASLEDAPGRALEALTGLPPPADLLQGERTALADRALALIATATGALGPGGATPPSLHARLRIVGAALPERGLPPALTRSLLKHATNVHSREADVPLGLVLAELCPDDFDVQREIGELALRGGLTPKLRAQLYESARRAAELAPDPTTRHEVEAANCDILLAIGRHQECLRLVSAVLPHFDDEPVSKVGLLEIRARALKATGDLEAALADIDDACALNESIEVLRLRAMVLFALGRRDEAFRDAMRFMTVCDEHAPHVTRVALLVWVHGRATKRTDDVRRALERAAVARPASAAEHVRLALIRLETGASLDDVAAALSQAHGNMNSGWTKALAPRTAAALAAARAGERQRLRGLLGELEAQIEAQLAPLVEHVLIRGRDTIPR